MSSLSAVKIGKLGSYVLYPLVVWGSTMATAWFCLHTRWAQFSQLAAGTIVLCAAALVSVLERKFPFYPTWNESRQDQFEDLVHTVVSGLLLQGLGRWFVFTLAAQLKLTTLWPTQWPWVAQLALALVLGEFGSYWTHRWMHEKNSLWKFHRLHHSSERLYWLNATRMHPVDGWISVLAFTFPLAVLGVPTNVMDLLGVYASTHAMLQHANLPVKLGPLRNIFSVAEVHRWHHSRKLHEANANYGAILLCWDHCFKTYGFPSDRVPPVEVGLVDEPTTVHGVFSQWVEPWSKPSDAAARS